MSLPPIGTFKYLCYSLQFVRNSHTILIFIAKKITKIRLKCRQMSSTQLLSYTKLLIILKHELFDNFLPNGQSDDTDIQP